VNAGSPVQELTIYPEKVLRNVLKEMVGHLKDGERDHLDEFLMQNEANSLDSDRITR